MDWKTISNNVLIVGLFVTIVAMFNQLGGRLDAMQAENQRQHAATRAEMSELRAETNRRFDAIQGQHAATQAEIDQLRAEMNRRFDAMQRQHDTTRAEIDQLRTEMNRRFDTMQVENQRQHDAMQEVLRVFEGRITRLEENIQIGPGNAE